MKTRLKTGPGFFAADTNRGDRDVPRGTMRVYCARLEAYDLEIGDQDGMDLETNFPVLFRFADDCEDSAKAMLRLLDALKDNEEAIRERAGR